MNIPPPEILALLSDPEWRLNNLYHIIDKKGDCIKFKMNPAQKKYYHEAHNRNNILKSRQHGFSTLIYLMMVDYALFNPTKRCGFIDQKEDDAKKKLAKMAFALKHIVDGEFGILGEYMKRTVGWDVTALAIRFGNESEITTGLDLRGDTFHFLWVSELGPIAFKDPARAKRIKTGTFPTVHGDSWLFIESTHEGGKTGLNYEIIEKAQEHANSGYPLTNKDFKLHFFAWYDDANNRTKKPEGYEFDERMVEYFKKLEDKDIELDDNQKFWYIKTESEQGEDMLREHPSTPEEAINAVVKGAIYGKIIDRLRFEGRILNFSYDQSCPVDTFWDIGGTDFTCIIAVQKVGLDWRILDYYSNHKEQPEFYVGKMREWDKKYNTIRTHWLPWDANHGANIGSSVQQRMNKAGMTNTRLGPKAKRKQDVISCGRSLLPSCIIHADNCSVGWRKDDSKIPSFIECMSTYHTKEQLEGGVIQNMPVHDEFSHGCFTADTLVLTEDGYRTINNISVGDYVITPQGKRKVIGSGITGYTNSLLEINGGLRCTKDHKFLTTNGLTRADELDTLSHVWTPEKSQSSLFLKMLNINYRDAIMLHPLVIVSLIATYIDRYGHSIMEKYQKSTTSTIKTAIHSTIELKTSNVYQSSNIYQCMLSKVNGLVLKKIKNNFLKSLFLYLKNGTHQKKVISFIVKQLKNIGIQNLFLKRHANIAEKNLTDDMQGQSFVKESAHNEVETGLILESIKENVYIAVANLLLKLPRVLRCIAGQNAKGKQLQSVREIKLKNPVPVYNIEVDVDHCFYADGILVSNCDSYNTFAQVFTARRIEGHGFRDSRVKANDDPDDPRGRRPKRAITGLRGEVKSKRFRY